MTTSLAPDPLIRSLLWRTLGRAMFRCTFHNWYRLRREMLRAFGARVAASAKIRRTVDVDRPWNFSAGSLALIGDGAVFRARSSIAVGARCTVSQMATITTEMRDAAHDDFPVTAAPIDIGDDCWVAADALVMPGVTLGQGAVVGARSMVQNDAPPWTVVAGEPAHVRRTRIMQSSRSE